MYSEKQYFGQYFMQAERWDTTVPVKKKNPNAITAIYTAGFTSECGQQTER